MKKLEPKFIVLRSAGKDAWATLGPATPLLHSRKDAEAQAALSANKYPHQEFAIFEMKALKSHQLRMVTQKVETPARPAPLVRRPDNVVDLRKETK